MSPVCDHCRTVVEDVDDVVLHRNLDDGFALYAYRCRACGRDGVGGDRQVVASLLARGVRVAAMHRTDLARPVDEAAITALRAVLDRDDWYEELQRLG